MFKGIRLRQVVNVRFVVRRFGQKVRVKRTTESVEIAFPAVGTVAGRVQRCRMEVAVDVRVSLQLYGTGRWSQTGPG